MPSRLPRSTRAAAMPGDVPGRAVERLGNMPSRTCLNHESVIEQRSFHKAFKNARSQAH